MPSANIELPDQSPESKTRFASRILLGSLVLLIAFRVLCLGMYPLSDNTESRYAEIARRMAESGDWITLRISDSVVFWGKPPLSSWLSATGIRLFGVNEWAARLPSALLAIGVTFLVWRWAAGRSRRWAGLSMAILWGSGAFFVAAGAVMTDMALLMSVSIAMFGFWHAVSGERRGTGRIAGYLFFAGQGLGMLAKGPVAILLVGLPVVAWSLLTGNLVRAIRSMPWFAGSAIALIICAPWYALAEIRTPGFLEYFLIGEHWSRFTQPGWSGDLYGTAHVQPRGSIWIYVLAGMLPWTLLIGGLMLSRRRDASDSARLARDERLFLLLWALAPGAIFTMAGNILWTYTLPALPALAVLLGHLLASDARQKLIDGVASVGVLLTGGVFAALLLGQGTYGGINSAKGVVEGYKRSHPGGSDLIFIGPSAYSSQFYAGRQLQTFPDGQALARFSSDRARAAGICPLQVHLAVHRKRWDEIPETLRQTMHAEARYGDYLLVVSNWQFGGAIASSEGPAPGPAGAAAVDCRPFQP